MILFCAARPKPPKPQDRFKHAWVITLCVVAVWAALLLPIAMLLGG